MPALMSDMAPPCPDPADPVSAVHRGRDKCRMAGNNCRMAGNNCRMAGNKCRIGELGGVGGGEFVEGEAGLDEPGSTRLQRLFGCCHSGRIVALPGGGEIPFEAFDQ
jgi:hypothetical protein